MSDSKHPQDVPLASPEVLRLVSELTDGEATAADRERLRHLLARDDQALAYYVAWCEVHAALHYDLVCGDVDLLAYSGKPKVIRPGRANRAPGRWRAGWSVATGLATAAACLAIFYLASTWRTTTTDRGPTAALPAAGSGSFARYENPKIQRFREKQGEPVAVLASAIDAVWAGDARYRAGSGLGRGPVELTKGLAQIEFLSGATVVVEAPAKIELLGPLAMKCLAGKLRAHVPNQAIGFVVETPSQRVVDLGTEFAVRVGEDSDEVHVLDGEVRVESHLADATQAGSDQVLRVGEAVRRAALGRMDRLDAATDDFVGLKHLAELLSQESTGRAAMWQKYREELKTDSSLILNYGFEGAADWERVLRHDGERHAEMLEGAIVGCRWSNGRWPWKRALEFKQTSDRVRLTIPGEYESISLCCWLRIDGFDRWLSSILLTDGHELGEPHWQFTETGQLLLGVKASDVSEEYLSPSVLELVDLGRWIQLACVYDGPMRRVTHYVDGRKVCELPIERETNIRFGPTEVGNWSAEGFQDHTVRSLNGRVDELLLFDRPLSDDEIVALYESGRP